MESKDLRLFFFCVSKLLGATGLDYDSWRLPKQTRRLDRNGL
jgi:hypothetical protein